MRIFNIFSLLVDCNHYRIMLKSYKTGDRYDNVTLSNLKILSSTRYHTANKCIDLNYIDSVIRDIQLKDDIAEVSENESDKPEVLKQESVELDNSSEQINNLVEVKEPSIPYVMSIQYSDYMDINNVIESFLKDNYSKNIDNEVNIVSDEPCKHCNSIEILQTNQLIQISSWRKSLMNSVIQNKYF